MNRTTDRKSGGIDFRTVRALLNKSRYERQSAFRAGNFDVVGFLLKLVLAGAIIALFAVFFSRFAAIYVTVKTNGMADIPARSDELLTILYSAIVVGMVVGGIGQIGREVFSGDDLKLYAAMPISAKTLFAAKLINIYLGQLVIALAAVLTVNITFAVTVGASFTFYALSPVVCVLLPLITIAISSALVIPFQALKRFLRERYIITFILITAILGVTFWLYSIVLGGVKELLLGDSIRWFFNVRVMENIASVCKFLLPAGWFAHIMTGSDALSWLWIFVVAAVCLAVSLVVIKTILVRSLQSRNEGYSLPILRSRSLPAASPKFAALLKKEFLMIFRTPGYMFSYLSVAVIMPLMVYFCMDVGSSLVENLVGLDCGLELAIFLTVLFGALTNVFCATNISREGEMFYTLKALPLNYKQVFFSKIVFCMIVAAISQIVSAVTLAATGVLVVADSVFLVVIGIIFGFANIAVATRYDFNHARFSTEDDGEIKESSGTVSAVVVMGMASAFVVGAFVFTIRAMSQLREVQLGFLTYVISAAAAVVFAAAATLYLLFRLDKKYYEFTGGGV